MDQELANTNVININDSEKKIIYLFRGLYPLYFDSIFKKMSSSNIQNVSIKTSDALIVVNLSTSYYMISHMFRIVFCFYS